MKIKLNLIPDYKREEINKNEHLRFVRREGLSLSFIFIFLFSGLFCFDYIIKMNLSLVSNSVQSGNKRESFGKVKKIDEEFGKINKDMEQVEKIQKDQFYWSEVLLKLNALIPEAVAINNLATKDYKILISGTSNNREGLLEFKGNLEKEKCFSAISLPLSDLVSKDNVDFQMDFNVNRECLKK